MSTQPLGAFGALLLAAEDGKLADELSDRVKELVGTMAEEQRRRGGKPKGSLTLSLGFSLDSGGVMEVVANVTLKEPKAERSRSIFYALRDNTLSPNNPKQYAMDLEPNREVPAAELRVI